MFYTIFKLDWLSCLAHVRIFGRVRAGLLTLGHLRTLEAVENAFVVDGKTVTPHDVGQVLAASRLPWRTFRRRIERASRLLKFDVWRCTPTREDDGNAVIRWWKEQHFFPARAHESEAETKAMLTASAHAYDHAATPTMRLALAVTNVNGWQTVLDVDSVWDVPLIAANHLLAAHAENNGAYHFNAQLIEG